MFKVKLYTDNDSLCNTIHTKECKMIIQLCKKTSIPFNTGITNKKLHLTPINVTELIINNAKLHIVQEKRYSFIKYLGVFNNYIDLERSI